MHSSPGDTLKHFFSHCYFFCYQKCPFRLLTYLWARDMVSSPYSEAAQVTGVTLCMIFDMAVAGAMIFDSKVAQTS